MSIRYLISLVVVLALLPIAVFSFSVCEKLEYRHEEISDEIAMYKLRRIWLLSYERHIETDHISFIFQDKQFELGLKNNHLVLSPGTQIFIDEVDALEFIERGDFIYVIYQREGKHYEKIIGDKEGLYFDDFLPDINGDSESDDVTMLSDENVS